MENSWKKAAKFLKNRGVVIIPSDSCYGIAALASNQEAVGRVYRIKAREFGKPSLLIVGSTDQARELVEFTPLAEKLARKHWPGVLTIILKTENLKLPRQIYGIDYTPGVSSKVEQGLHTGSEPELTLAVRFPDKKELQDLALEVGPFILPSANLAGLKPPFKPEDVDKKLKNQVDFFLDEPTNGNSPSTIVDARGEKSKILRKGAVIVEERS